MNKEYEDYDTTMPSNLFPESQHFQEEVPSTPPRAVKNDLIFRAIAGVLVFVFCGVLVRFVL